MKDELNFEVEPFAFEWDSSEGELEVPGGSRKTPVPVTTSSVIDTRIDVHAQYAVLRLSKGDAGARADAAGMLGAVKSGALGGIYKEDEQVPALRAKRQGRGWWQVIPRGEDAHLFAAPPESPLIVFRDQVRSNAARLDPALRKAWARLAPKPTRPPEPRGCPVSRAVLAAVSEAGAALPSMRATARALRDAKTPEPKLCFFQNTTRENAVELFRQNARNWARVISAIAEPGTPDQSCGLVGATPFHTGADIIRHIEATPACVGSRIVSEVHIFSHSFPEGIIGTGDWDGLYLSDPVNYFDFNLKKRTDAAVNRGAGGRVVTDVRASTLTPDVIFIFHGCSTAKGDKNLARGLFEHLAKSLDNPRVFGHPHGACAGQRKHWREYSKASPAGEKTHTTIPFYGGSCPGVKE